MGVLLLALWASCWVPLATCVGFLPLCENSSPSALSSYWKKEKSYWEANPVRKGDGGVIMWMWIRNLCISKAVWNGLEWVDCHCTTHSSAGMCQPCSLRYLMMSRQNFMLMGSVRVLLWHSAAFQKIFSANEPICGMMVAKWSIMTVYSFTMPWQCAST